MHFSSTGVFKCIAGDFRRCRYSGQRPGWRGRKESHDSDQFKAVGTQQAAAVCHLHQHRVPSQDGRQRWRERRHTCVRTRIDFHSGLYSSHSLISPLSFSKQLFPFSLLHVAWTIARFPMTTTHFLTFTSANLPMACVAQCLTKSNNRNFSLTWTRAGVSNTST